jgi:predicted amidohydrolase
MNVFAVQLDIVWHDKQANHQKADALLDRANIPAGSLVVLPEMFATGFSMAVPEITDDVKHETEQWILQTARRRNVAVMAGLVTRAADGRGRNEALIAFPDGRTPVRYQKLQPFTLGGETKNFEAGNQIVLFEWQGFQIAPFICYDLRFPELFRAATLKGAQVLINIASWPIMRDEHWVTLLKARAIENLCYVVGVNRCGKDPNFLYSGRSLILGPQAGEIANAGTVEGVISGHLGLQPLLDWRKAFPALSDIRREFLGPEKK